MGIKLKVNGVEREYDQFHVEVNRQTYFSETMPYYYLYARRKELFRERWDIIECGTDVDRILDRLEELKGQLDEANREIDEEMGLREGQEAAC